MKKEEDQAALLRKARATLKKTNEQLAADLGVSVPTLLAWLAPKTAAKHRTMPRGSRMLLARVLSDHRAGRKG